MSNSFIVINTLASSDFASTTGFTINALTSYATSSVFTAMVGAPFDFLKTNLPQIISYGMIAVVLSLPFSAFVYYKRH